MFQLANERLSATSEYSMAWTICQPASECLPLIPEFQPCCD
jgi:hypothetical protein